MKKIGFLFFCAILSNSCATKQDTVAEQPPSPQSEQSLASPGNARAEIEAYISAHWESYGYSAVPTKFIALSFDDGPCPPSDHGGTAALLDVLREHRVRTTFFVIGQNIRSNRGAAEAIFEAGHELANHSDGYSGLGSASVEVITASLTANSQLIREITGEYPVIFRAPNLNHGDNLSQVSKTMGMALIDGTAHNDWPGNAEAVKASVLANPQDGDIIILHENNTSHGNTMSVLPDIIAELRARGFWIMTVSELAAVREKTLEAGVRYSAFR